jgi:acetyltransferase-like isoleucine patch superfamily enzyme
MGFGNFLTWLRGLAQLRHPSLVRALGEWRFELDLLEQVRAENPGAKIDLGVILVGWCPGALRLAPGSAVCRGTVLAFGDPGLGHGRITVGEGTWIGQYNNLRACPEADVVIGADCLVSQFCTLVASNHGTRRGIPIQSQPPDPRRLGVTLGDDVWLGAGATILPGVSIGNGAVIGANSVVTASVSANEIWIGSPARLHSPRA